MNKIIVIGCPGAGKTTLATRLGQKLNIPVYHLDKYFWKDNWTHLSQEEFREVQNDLMKVNRWILDGNLTKSIDNRIVKADTVIFFDFSKWVIYWRILKRYLMDFGKVRHDMGGNNPSAIKWNQLKYIWNFPRREIYSLIGQHKEGKRIIILHSPKEVKEFLSGIRIN